MVNKASCNKIKNWNCYVMLKQKIRWIKEYGPIRPYSVILVIMWQHDHGTNKYVKWMILGPKDEAQSPSKAKWRKNSKKCRIGWVQHKVGRRCNQKVQQCNWRASEESSTAPVKPTVQRRRQCIGLTLTIVQRAHQALRDKVSGTGWTNSVGRSAGAMT